MSNYIRIALAIDLLLLGVEHLAPSMTEGVLPLGGTEFIQVAVLLLLGVATHELFSDRNKSK